MHMGQLRENELVITFRTNVLVTPARFEPAFPMCPRSGTDEGDRDRQIVHVDC
jgi:hypothetical protein